MDKNNPSLLPYIMDLLSRQPKLFTTKEDLVKSIRDIVLEEHIGPFGSLEGAVEFSLDVGVSLGIISLTDEKVRVPFNFRMSRHKERETGGARISPKDGRKAIRQRMPKPPAKAAKLMGKKGARLRKVAGKAVGKTTGKTVQKKRC
ncbi:uncharacterized protein LOC108050475 [Drosophila rhopaloa]|uniref:Uncharacterized protein LOC108050475 n=1 Tax=Drosophila rhopaloa TaxID=1041015 RepID=A0A6P4FC37_DRORH|nr:uncharacterized protein LOC108050475 [Drosophila rhopaloa]